MNLKEYWHLTSNHYFPFTMSEGIFKAIAQAYNHSSRHYHNLGHIQDLFEKLEQVETTIENKEVIQFSIWFHDVIYSTLRKDNELKSAMYALEAFSPSSFPPELQELVYQYILASKKHIPVPQQSDLELFLDLDLSILAAEKERYLVYTQQVRKEYHLVPTIVYKVGRKKVLQSFLERESIFYTEEFFERFEAKARTNISLELASV